MPPREYRHEEDVSDCECSECGNEDVTSDESDSEYEPSESDDDESDDEDDFQPISDDELIQLGLDYLEMVGDLARAYRCRRC